MLLLLSGIRFQTAFAAICNVPKLFQTSPQDPAQDPSFSSSFSQLIAVHACNLVFLVFMLGSEFFIDFVPYIIIIVFEDPVWRDTPPPCLIGNEIFSVGRGGAETSLAH